MRKQEPTIRLSSQKCVACAKSGFLLKSEPREFSAPVCVEHLVTRLTEWEAEDRAEAAKEQQRRKDEKTKKEKPNASVAS